MPSGIPPVCWVITRTPFGPSSRDKVRRSASIAQNDTWNPP
jgi:hypothetical protein